MSFVSLTKTFTTWTKRKDIAVASSKTCSEEAGYWRAAAGKGAAAEMKVIVGVEACVEAGAGVALAGGAIAVRSRNSARTVLAHDGEYKWGRRG